MELEFNKISVTNSDNTLDPIDVHFGSKMGAYGSIPPYVIPNPGAIIRSVDNIDAESLKRSNSVHSLLPLKVRKIGEEQWFTFPLEPLVSVSCKNIMVRRSVAKSKVAGTIKERWSQDDYSISIIGCLSNQDDIYPESDVRKIVELFNERQSLEICQEILLLLGIKFMAIESLNLPHTKGLGNQNFEIKGYSDENTDLLIEI